MREKKMKVVNKSQPQKVNSQGMEVFLSTPKEVEKPEKIQSEQLTKPSTNTKEEAKQIKINKEEKETQANLAQNRYDEIEYNIRKIEEQLMKSKTLDLTTFNNIVFAKKLSFKLLFIKSKIYVVVRDTNGRNAIVSIIPPKFGGSSLRYLITQCNDWCTTIKKKTSKGEILSYQPLNNSNEELDDGDIFD